MTAVESVPRSRSEAGGKTLLVDELSVGFGGLLALDEVSMSVDPGEIVGVIGPNGAGKTTLFNVICGFVHADSGVDHLRRDVAARSTIPHDLAKLGIARTLQGVGLCAGLTVLENVMLGAQPVLRSDIGSAFLGLWRSSREERRAAGRARELLDELGVAELRPPVPRRRCPTRMQKRDGAGPGADGASPACSCSTSRPAGSPRRHGRAGDADPRPHRRAWVSCSSSTTWTWSCRCATASSCSTSVRSSPRARPRSVRSNPRGGHRVPRRRGPRRSSATVRGAGDA